MRYHSVCCLLMILYCWARLELGLILNWSNGGNNSNLKILDKSAKQSTSNAVLALVALDGKKLPKSECVESIGSILQRNRGIDQEVTHKIKLGGPNGEQHWGYCVTIVYL